MLLAAKLAKEERRKKIDEMTYFKAITFPLFTIPHFSVILIKIRMMINSLKITIKVGKFLIKLF